MINAARLLAVMGVLLLISPHASADGVERRLLSLKQNGVTFYQEYNSERAEIPWRILVHRESPHEEVLSVSNLEDGQRNFQHFQDLNGTDRFISLEVVDLAEYENPVIVALWSRGVHGEQIYVFDPSLKSKFMLAHHISNWPIGFKEMDGRLVFEITKSNNDVRQIIWPMEK